MDCDLMGYKPLVLTFEALPIENNTEGDKRLVLFDRLIYEWTGAEWVEDVSVEEKIRRKFTIEEPA